MGPGPGSPERTEAHRGHIFAARERLYLTNAYFVPDEGLRDILCQAARRGVDVRVLTPGRNTLLVRDAALAAELEDAFRADLRLAREVSVEELRARPITDRVKERLSRLVAPVL